MTHKERMNFKSQILIKKKKPQAREGVSQIFPDIPGIVAHTKKQPQGSGSSVKLFSIFYPELNQGLSDSTGIPEQRRQILSLKTHISQTLHKF